MAERRNRKHSKIDGLPPDLKATVQQMLLDGDTYSEVIAYLQTQASQSPCPLSAGTRRRIWRSTRR